MEKQCERNSRVRWSAVVRALMDNIKESMKDAIMAVRISGLSGIKKQTAPQMMEPLTGHIEKDHGKDEIVIQTRTFFGRIAIAGKPFGELRLGQDVSILMHPVP